MTNERQTPGMTDPSGLTERIIGCAFRVSNTLGCGLLEQDHLNHR